MKYQFRYKNGGWWLCLRDYVELIDYHQMDVAIRNGVLKILDVKPKPRKSFKDDGDLTTMVDAIVNKALNNEISVPEAAAKIAGEKIGEQIKWMRKGYYIFVNPYGGWNAYKPDDYEQFYDSEILKWPSFTKDDIKIEQFEGGDHYYVYLGNLQLRDGDKLKFNSKSEARAFAERYIDD